MKNRWGKYIFRNTEVYVSATAVWEVLEVGFQSLALLYAYMKTNAMFAIFSIIDTQCNENTYIDLSLNV